MESRLLVLLLAGLPLAGLVGCAGSKALVQTESAEQEPVIEPEVERREIEPADIDTENFEVGIFAGRMNVEDFGSNTVVGGRLAYHVTEKFFTELAFGQTDTTPTSFERLSGAAQLLTADQRQYSYYNLLMGYNLLPGEGFVGEKRALNTQFYVIGGVGSTDFAGDDRFTVTIGAGMRFLPLDWLAVHADVRDHMFDIDVIGEKRQTHNLEANFGVTFFF